MVRVYNFLSDPSLIMLGPATLFGTTAGGLIMLGNLSRKMIVQVYVTGDNRFVRLTRLTFFGRRQDMVLPVSRILPLTENNESKRNLLLTLETIPPENTIEGYDRPEFYDESFKICLKHGGVLDEIRFEMALGTILRTKIYS